MEHVKVLFGRSCPGYKIVYHKWRKRELYAKLIIKVILVGLFAAD